MIAIVGTYITYLPFWWDDFTQKIAPNGIKKIKSLLTKRDAVGERSNKFWPCGTRKEHEIPRDQKIFPKIGYNITWLSMTCRRPDPPSKKEDINCISRPALWPPLPPPHLCEEWLFRPLNYSWIGRPIRADKKIICQCTRRVTTLSRPPLESSRRGESKSAGSIFVKVIYDLFFQNNF